MSDDADNAEPAEDGPLKLERAAVAGVLGEYTHSFEFSDERDFVILYGPNGVGKTKFLETIHALMRLDAAKLLRLPFDRAELDFADGTRLSALKQLEQGPIDLSELPGKARVAIMFIIERKGVVKGSWPYAPGSFEEFLIESTSWANIGDDLWEDQDDGEVARLSDLESRYRTRVREGGNQSTRKQMPAPFSNLQSRLKSHLIETQRLRIENYIDASNPRRRPGSP
ncbi:hypothetical protein, partial [Pseudolysinimonas sp.]|uniref:hypothetical protein n=1 Tax=Pseudolysinimonas sp. TaxID=2680009 RepID=UPI003782E923